MLTMRYVDAWDDERVLALCSEECAGTGWLALVALDATDPTSEDYLDTWAVATVNLPNDPLAMAWCSLEGRVVLDSNNCGEGFVSALLEEGLVELPGASCRSGWCEYPLAALTPKALEAIEGCEETAKALGTMF